MDKGAREQYMLDQLARMGMLSVSALARDLGVSEVTIRANLRDLEGRGLLSRTHGGAQSTSFQSVLERRRQHAPEKERIAAAAAAMVNDGDRIMVEAGTTTSLVIPHLSERAGVQIVTNSTLVFATARRNPALRVTLTGGTFSHESESLVGPHALRTIDDFNVRLAFVGTDGFTTERGLTTGFAEGADVIRAMSGRAQATWLLADSSKYGRAGFVSVLSLDRLAGMITDDHIDGAALAELRAAVDEVLVV